MELLRRRFPFLGLFLAAVCGTLLSAGSVGTWPLWIGLFGTVCFPAIWFRTTPLTLVAFLLFFAFWSDFQVAADQGYRLMKQSGRRSQIHAFLVEVCSAPTSFQWGSTIHQRFVGKVIEFDGRKSNFFAEINIPDRHLSYGDQLRLDSRIGVQSAPLNPGEFDYAGYLQRRHIYVELQPVNAASLSPGPPGRRNSLVGFLIQFRQNLEDTLSRGIEDDPEVLQIVRGIAFGDRRGMSPDLADLLQRSGTLHLFVVDGLKVTLFAGLAWLAARLCKLGQRWAGLSVLPMLALYGLMTGFSAASLRATLMCTFLFSSISLERPANALNTLAASGTLVLLHDPQELFDAGFQLSFTAVLAILTFVRPLAKWMAAGLQPDPFLPTRLLSPFRRTSIRFGNIACQLSALSIVCWFASFPVLAIQFHRVSLTGLVTNIILVPVGTWILMLSAGSLLLAPFSGWTSVCLNNANWMLAKLFLAVLRISTTIPYDSLNIAPPSLERCPVLTALATGRSMVFHFHAAQTEWLLNTGNEGKWRFVTEPYLRFRGINVLDGILLDHQEAHSQAALKAATDRFRCRQLVDLTHTPGPQKSSGAIPSPYLRKTGTTIFASDRSNLSITAPSLSGRSGSQGKNLLYRVNGFRFLIGTHLNAANLSSAGQVDVVFVSSVGRPNPQLLRAALQPQVIVSEFEPREPSSDRTVPILILPRDGAITIEVTGDQCTLKAFRGRQMVIRRR